MNVSAICSKWNDVERETTARMNLTPDQVELFRKVFFTGVIASLSVIKDDPKVDQTEMYYESLIEIASRNGDKSRLEAFVRVCKTFEEWEAEREKK